MTTNQPLASMAQRIVALFDTASAPAATFTHMVDPKTGDIKQVPRNATAPLQDGELDLEELDLSLVCFASDQMLDAIAFLRQVDADGNGRISAAELEKLLGTIEPIEQQSLAQKLDQLQSAQVTFSGLRAEIGSASRLTKPLKFRALGQADARYQQARQDFVECLVAYARPGIG